MSRYSVFQKQRSIEQKLANNRKIATEEKIHICLCIEYDLISQILYYQSRYSAFQKQRSIEQKLGNNRKTATEEKIHIYLCTEYDLILQVLKVLLWRFKQEVQVRSCLRFDV